MKTPLIITLLGSDQRGLVNSISNTIEEHQGSWSESRMAHLAGKFAGILQVSLPEENIDKLTTALNELQSNDLKILVEQATTENQSSSVSTLDIELLCQDRIGIINDITEGLAKLNVNIEELDSHVKEASMSGGMLFCAELTLGLPKGISDEDVEGCLEQMSDQFMIDIKMSSN